MPNIAAVMREEIVRLARKEVRTQLRGAQKAMRQLRSANTVLRRDAADMNARLNRLERKTNGTLQDAPTKQPSRRRFNAKGLATHRGKLGLSAANYGKLLGVTGQTIYNWERGDAKPRAAQLLALAPIRGLGKRAAAERLQEMVKRRSN